MFRYELFFEDGSEPGDAACADNVTAGEVILIGAGQRLRVLAIAPVEDDDSPYSGLSRVAAALRTVPELATFACGGASAFELEVDQIVHDLHRLAFPVPMRLTKFILGFG